MEDYIEKTVREEDVNNRPTANISTTDIRGSTLEVEVRHAAGQWFNILLLHHNNLSKNRGNVDT